MEIMGEVEILLTIYWRLNRLRVVLGVISISQRGHQKSINKNDSHINTSKSVQLALSIR